MEKEVYFSYRKGDDVKKVSPDSKLIPLLEADGWEAEVYDQPQAPKVRKKKEDMAEKLESEE